MLIVNLYIFRRTINAILQVIVEYHLILLIGSIITRQCTSQLEWNFIAEIVVSTILPCTICRTILNGRSRVIAIHNLLFKSWK